MHHADAPAFYSYNLNLPVEKDLVLRIEEKKFILRQHQKVKSDSVRCFLSVRVQCWWLILIGHVRIHAYIRSPRNLRTESRVCSYGHHLQPASEEQSNLSYAITRCATKSQIGTTAAHSKLVVAQLVPIHGNSCRLCCFSSTILLHGTVGHTYLHT